MGAVVGPSSPQRPRPRPLFPSVAELWGPGDVASVPERVSEPTVFGPDLVAKPLASHCASYDPAHYPPPNQDDNAGISAPLQAFKEPYLFPTLSKHEWERVTSLWYYTRDIQHDKPFLAHLQRTVDLVRELTERDCVIMGLLDLDYYTRLVTSNVPLAVIPRREATCSHTILQEPGTVFMLSDIKGDWRFATSPHVEAGLSFYAGTQMCYTVGGASSEVVFGSLCVASWTPQPPLSAQQQRTLKRFAGILVHDIVERARSVRATGRHKMSTTLAQVTAKANAHNVVELILDALRSTYPGAIVSQQDRPDSTIALHNNRDVPYAEFENFLWEDSAAIDQYILTSNHIPWVCGAKSFRAIAVKRSIFPHRYLVVQTADMKRVFDDIDAAFVQSCALIMCNVEQAHRLEEALAAKTRFLRGAAHQLRTPIHAILSTCELMLDQARSQAQLLGPATVVAYNQDTAASPANAVSTLNLINTSGRSLLSTVNNLLNFDRLGSVRPATQLISLAPLEQELLDQVASGAAERGLTLVCDNRLPPNVHLLDCDLDLLKQCLGAVLQNAVDFTHRGSVVLRTSLEPDYTALDFDVIDTGTGIAGLGLPVAAGIASALGGAVTLVASSEHGLHFRVRFAHTSLSCQREHVRQRALLAFVARHLERLGFFEAPAGSAALALVQTFTEAGPLDAVLQAPCVGQTVLYVCRDEAEAANVRAVAVKRGADLRIITCLAPLGRAGVWRAVQGALDTWDAMDHTPALGALESSLPARVPPFFPPPRRRLASLRILIVDDNRANLDILCMNAKRQGFPYLTTMDGLQAVDAFNACQTPDSSSSCEPVSLVLMGLQMPLMNGVDATARIREYEAENNLPPCLIYMVTGQSSNEDKHLAIKAGADGYFVKPLSLRMLNDLIHLHFPK